MTTVVDVNMGNRVYSDKAGGVGTIDKVIGWAVQVMTIDVLFSTWQ